MKKTLIAGFCMLIHSVFSQFSPAENEMMEIVKEHGAFIPKEVFLDTSVVHHMQLANSTSWRHLWTEKEDATKYIKQFYDIRLLFDSKKEALNFHKKYLGLNAEFGEKIKQHGLEFEGASDLKVYSGSQAYLQMMEPYGFQVFCILFVVDEYFVKLYITCVKEYSLSSFQPFVTESIQKIKARKK